MARDFARVGNHRLLVQRSDAGRKKECAERNNVCKTHCADVDVMRAFQLQVVVELARVHFVAGSIHQPPIHVDRVFGGCFACFSRN